MAVALLGSCSDSAAPTGSPRLVFEPAVVALDTAGPATVVIRNTGDAAAGPLEMAASQLRDTAGTTLVGPSVAVSPRDIATLNPGAERTVTLSLTLAPLTQPGRYVADLAVRSQGNTLASLDLDIRVDQEVTGAPGQSVAVMGGPSTVRQGDVAQYTAEVRDSAGAEMNGAVVHWSVVPSTAGVFSAGGRFVGYDVRDVRVVARSGAAADTLDVTVQPRALSGSFTTVGQGSVPARFSADLWVHGGTLYTGTWGGRTVNGVTQFGNALFAWDITNPTQPAIVDSVIVDARVVNDVKVRADGRLAVITHEASGDGKNGVTLLDLSDPHHPSVITRFTNSLETGVHNAWIEGDYVYLVVDGTSATSGLRVLDISNPTQPTVMASFHAGSSFLHDVYVRDGLALLSHWDAGLVIVDVGNGIAGGSPTNPVEVSRVLVAGGQTHNAWYWPDAGYVFVGEEDFATPGIIHVVDVRDLRSPVEVATFQIGGGTPHNFWLDEATGMLYLAWYENGVRALDVTGELMGQLERQGREVAALQYSGGSGCPASVGGGTCAWAPQLKTGLVYVSDMNTGVWVLQPQF
jgi:hypothetical protein